MSNSHLLALRRVAGVLVLTGELSACLPEDGRPRPGRLIVFATADQALAEGTDTTDGWRIVYERFLLSLGEVHFDGSGKGEDCNPYSGSTYLRVLDMRQPGQQTVATHYGLGECRLGLDVRGPAEDPEHDEDPEHPPVVAGAGVDEETLRFLRTSGSDAFVRQGGIAVHVAGTSTKADVITRFGWSFRQSLGYSGCSMIALSGGQTQTVEIQVRGAKLFEDPSSEQPVARFAPYAQTDANGDGEISLDELAAVPDSEDFETLAARLYLGLVPQLLSFPDGQSCFDGPLEDR